MLHTKTFYIGDVEFEVEFSASRLIPAKTYGPPENCHPEEGGEVEIESVSIGDFEVSDVISDAARNTLQRMAEEAAYDCEADARDTALADSAEARYYDREGY